MSTLENNSTKNVEKQETGVVKATNNINYNEGTILYKINVDKYSREIKEYYLLEDKATGYKINIKLKSMLELAILENKEKPLTLLLNNGYPASGNMSAGAGKAVKIEKSDDWYHCIFFESELGKEFNPKKIQSKTFIKLSKRHLKSIFTFLVCNNEVKIAKEEELRVQRSTLDL